MAKKETSYSEAFGKLTKEGKVILQQVMDTWDPRIKENFQREHFLSAKQMETFMCSIIDMVVKTNGMPDREDMKMYIRHELIYKNYQLKGGKIEDEPYPHTVGFAMPLKHFKDFLSGKYINDYAGEVEEVNQIFQELEDTGVFYYPADLTDCPFKKEKCLIWVTWERNKAHAADPFYFSKSDTCREIKEILGLDDDRAIPPLLLFIVDARELTAQGVDLSKPTFCDADFGEKFRPTPLDFTLHGLTWPFSPTDSYSEKKHREKGRPEAVIQSRHMVLSKIKKVKLLNK
jgi:hypothetical protein